LRNLSALGQFRRENRITLCPVRSVEYVGSVDLFSEVLYLKFSLKDSRILISLGVLLLILVFVGVYILVPDFRSGISATMSQLFGNTSSAVSDIATKPSQSNFDPSTGQYQSIITEEGDLDFFNNPEQQPVEEEHDPYADYPVTARIISLNTEGASYLIQDGIYWVLVDTSTGRDTDKILSVLKENQVKSLRYLIITNYNTFALGGAEKILDSIPVDFIVVAESVVTEEEGKPLLRYFDQKRLLYTVGSKHGRYPLDQGVLEVHQTHEKGSLMLTYYHGASKIVFTGDLMRIDEDRLDLLPTYIDALYLSYRRPEYEIPSGLIDHTKPKALYATGTGSLTATKKLLSTLTTAEYANHFYNLDSTLEFVLNGYTIKAPKPNVVVPQETPSTEEGQSSNADAGVNSDAESDSVSSDNSDSQG